MLKKILLKPIKFQFSQQKLFFTTIKFDTLLSLFSKQKKNETIFSFIIDSLGNSLSELYRIVILTKSNILATNVLSSDCNCHFPLDWKSRQVHQGFIP